MSLDSAASLDHPALLDDESVVRHIHDYIDSGTTFTGDSSWREPTANYLSPDRFRHELAMIGRSTVVFCPSAALPEPGSYLARDAAGVPLLAIRGDDGSAQVFRNSCRHRGVQVAEGSGCKQAFVCPYHGWSYGKQGELRHVPHEHGFPDLDTATRGLVPVSSVEAGGLLFVNQSSASERGVDPTDSAALDPQLPVDDLVPSDHILISHSETVIETNWKLFMESFLEGYHIRSTHKTTFYPIQYDNLNWIEYVGSSTRVAFPYQSIEKLRQAPFEPGSINYYLTFVYHLFPNVIVATSPGVMNTIVLEPMSPGTTWMSSFFTGFPRDTSTKSSKRPKKRPDYQAALAEDMAMITSAQRGLATGANEFLEFGLFEGAIVKFHQRLERALGGDEVAVTLAEE